MTRSVFLSIVLLLFIGCTLLSSGCTTIPQRKVNQRIAELNAMLTPLLHTGTREDVVKVMGAPQQRDTIGSLEVWTYHLSYGSRHNAYASSYGQYGTYGTGNSREVFDDITLTFDSNGILSSYRGNIQR